MSHHIDEKELLRRIAGLPREIRPQNDPWPAISARLEQSGSDLQTGRFSRRWAMYAVAASLVMALTAGLLLGPRLSWRPVPGTGAELAMDGVPATQEAFRIPPSLAASEAEYQAAFREFIAVGQARFSLSASTISTIETGWADLREAEIALTAALAENPDDRFLASRMLELRARQLGFLQELASLDQSNRRLTI